MLPTYEKVGPSFKFLLMIGHKAGNRLTLCSKNVYEQHRANHDASQIRTTYGLTPVEVGHVEVLHELVSSLWYREANDEKLRFLLSVRKTQFLCFTDK